MLATPKRVLVLSPHPDDGEFGCGGTLVKFLEKNTEVFYSTFSLCEASIPDGYGKDHLKGELKAAMEELGVPESNLIIRNYPVRKFPEFRQDILENIIEDKKAISPDLVFLPSRSDIHQDHQVIANEGLRAYRNVSIFAYELPWNTIEFSATALSKLEEKHITKKARMLANYKSQSFRPYFHEDFVRSLARTRGTQIACDYAEAFEIPRLTF